MPHSRGGHRPRNLPKTPAGPCPEMHLPRGSAAPAAPAPPACGACRWMGERPRGKRPPLLISPSPLLSLPAHPRPAQGGPPALASRGNRAPLGSGARRWPGMRLPRARAAVPEMARDNGERGGAGGGECGQRRAPASPQLPPAPGAEGRQLPFPGAAAPGGAHGAGGVRPGCGCRTAGALRPRGRPTRPRQGKRSRCQTTCSAAGEEGGMGGVKEGRKSVGGGGLRGCHRGVRNTGRRGVSPGRGRAGAGERQAGAEERRGGTGEVPEPWAAPSSASSKPQGLKHAHTPPPRNLYTAQQGKKRTPEVLVESNYKRGLNNNNNKKKQTSKR